jgi:hypothetical protein
MPFLHQTICPEHFQMSVGAPAVLLAWVIFFLFHLLKYILLLLHYEFMTSEVYKCNATNGNSVKCLPVH